MIYGPKLFSLVERKGENPRLAVNGVVAGDSYGNGHFMTSGGAMTGMIGHGSRVLSYWQARSNGLSADDALNNLANSIDEDTKAWLKVSATEFTQAIPINFGADGARQIAAASGRDVDTRNGGANANKRERHALILLNQSDWRRLVVRPGKVVSGALPKLHPMHPSARKDSVRPETSCRERPNLRRNCGNSHCLMHEMVARYVDVENIRLIMQKGRIWAHVVVEPIESNG
jgi:hypothetical protein